MTHPLRIKVCGVTTAADAELAARCGADAVGLNFYPPSPRHVTPTAAAAILRALPPFIDAVGVFVNQTLPQMIDIAGRLPGLRTLQWHGDAPGVGDPLPFRLIVGFAVRGPESLEAVTEYLACCRRAEQVPAAILVDAHVPGQYGGTGQKAPWERLAGFAPGVPLILAGGLTPENVAEAVRIVRPYGVDVASGIESGPGRKDVDKMRRFIDNARSA